MNNIASILKSILESKARVLAALEFDAVKIAKVAEAGETAHIFYEGRQSDLEALDAVRKLKRQGALTVYVTSNPASCVIGVADTVIVAELNKTDFDIFVIELEGIFSSSKTWMVENEHQVEKRSSADKELMAKGIAAVMNACGVDSEVARGLLLKHGSVRKAIEIASASEGKSEPCSKKALASTSRKTQSAARKGNYKPLKKK